MSRKKEDPAEYGDVMSLFNKISDLESRVTSLETDVRWIKDSLEKLRSVLEEYKKTVIFSFFGASTLYIVISILMKLFGG